MSGGRAGGQCGVALAEKNYDNQSWQEPQAFARQIRLFEVGGRYTLLDVSPTARRNPEGGRIAGWLYIRWRNSEPGRGQVLAFAALLP